jgi:tellurite methyltransferase
MESNQLTDTQDVGTPVAKYDAAYSSLKDFKHEPNGFLTRCLERIAPHGVAAGSRALDLGVGQGRNAILLAQLGYDTLGIDRSEIGVAAVRHNAAELGCQLRAQVADAATYDFGRDCWDLVALLYYPLPILLIERIKAAVRPGGHIIVERFSQKKDTVGPDGEDAKLPNPMLRYFQDWNVLHYEHDVFQSDWHWSGESPTGLIVRLLARKP